MTQEELIQSVDGFYNLTSNVTLLKPLISIIFYSLYMSAPMDVEGTMQVGEYQEVRITGAVLQAGCTKARTLGSEREGSDPSPTLPSLINLGEFSVISKPQALPHL